MARCDPEIFRSGHLLIVFRLAKKELVEELCRRMSQTPKVKADWHYVGGRACLLYAGEYADAKAELLKWLPWFNDENYKWLFEEYEHIREEEAFRKREGWISYREWNGDYDEASIEPPKAIDIGQAIRTSLYNP